MNFSSIAQLLLFSFSFIFQFFFSLYCTTFQVSSNGEKFSIYKMQQVEIQTYHTIHMYIKWSVCRCISVDYIWLLYFNTWYWWPTTIILIIEHTRWIQFAFQIIIAAASANHSKTSKVHCLCSCNFTIEFRLIQT